MAVVENSAVQELTSNGRWSVASWATSTLAVVRVLPGMQSAFIDIGLERAAFLHVADLQAVQAGGNGRHNRNADTPTPIEKRLVFEGQALLVQVIKDPIGTKGAGLSSQISIAGRMLVHLPQDDTSASARRSARLRELLRTRMQALVERPSPRRWRRLHPAHQCRGSLRRRPGRRHRFTARDLAADPRQGTQRRAAQPAAPGPEPARSKRVLRDLTTERTQRHPHRLGAAVPGAAPVRRHLHAQVSGKLEHYRGERPIFDLCNIDTRRLPERWRASTS